ncbi:MAG: Mut7-C RNAse domain-containing protein [bacterium]
MRFYADGTCGDIVKWLRILGFDIIADYKNPTKLALRNSMKENRIFITRSETLRETQFEEVIKIPPETFVALSYLKERGLLKNIKPFTRCLVCNTELINVDRSSIKDRVLPYIFQTHSEFKKCPTCDKIYWQGTHIENMMKKLTDENII